MPDKTALRISEELRLYIEALVEEVIKGNPVENHKKFLRRFCDVEGVNYACLENNLMLFFEIIEEWKNNHSKSSQIAMKTLAKDCYVSEECLNRIFHTNAVPIFRKASELADDQLYPIRKNGVWGYMDRTGKMVFMVEAHHVVDAFDFKENLARIVVDYKGIRKGEGFIDKSGRIVIDPFFDKVEDFSNNRSIASIDGALGVIDKEGKWVISAYYDDIRQTFPNLFICGSELYDNNGREINIPFSVDCIGYASEGLLPVQKDYPEKWGFVNDRGELVIEPQYDEIGGFSDGLCAVRCKRSWAYIDRTGKKVIKKLSFSRWPISFRNGLSIAKIDGKYGIIDKRGKLLFESDKKINEDYSFKGWDLGVIEDGSNSILVDKTGKKIRVLPGVSIGSRAEYGLVKIYSKNGSYQYGLINTIGEQVVPCKFDSLYIRSNHFSEVVKKGKWGLVDNSNGKQVIPCKYDWLNLVSDGAAIIQINDKFGLIDLTDRIIVQPQYDGIWIYRDLLKITKDDKMGYMNKTGEIVYMEV